MANDTILSIFSTIYNFLFSLTKIQNDQKQKENVAIIMQNKKFQQSFMETSIHTTDITINDLVKNRHKINGLVDVLKTINGIMYSNILVTGGLNLDWNFLLTLAKISHRLKQI